MSNNKKLLVIGFVWPEPNSSAAGSRMMQLINCFLEQDYQITFSSPCTRSKKAFDLSTLGIKQVAIELNNSSFDTFVKLLNPDVVLFDRFMMEEQFGWRVTESCPNALRMLDTEDLHCLRMGRRQAFKENKDFDTSYLFNETAKREIASIYRCDLSLIISEAEIYLLTENFKVPEELLLYLPFMLDILTEQAIHILPIFNNREHFVAIGNFLHEPNYNAVRYLKESIWPMIRQQLPTAELHVYGAYASQKVNQLHHENEGFLIKGFVEDANQIMQNAKVCLAPLRFGAGLKGKLIQAMQNGTPCVMTSIAAEGMFGEFEPNGFVDNYPQQFATKAVELYNHETIWKEKQQNGFEIINTRFQKNRFQEPFQIRTQEVLQNLDKHRRNNFTGLMLGHHQLQSTKFMSKWIEAKNI